MKITSGQQKGRNPVRAGGGAGKRSLTGDGHESECYWFAARRMMRMHRKIQDEEYPNSGTFTWEFEVSVRTIKRDIDFMKTGLNKPIAFDVSRNAYYFTLSVPHFPQMPMSEREAFTILWSARRLSSFGVRRWSRSWPARFSR